MSKPCRQTKTLSPFFKQPRDLRWLLNIRMFNPGFLPFQVHPAKEYLRCFSRKGSMASPAHFLNNVIRHPNVIRRHNVVPHHTVNPAKAGIQSKRRSRPKDMEMDPTSRSAHVNLSLTAPCSFRLYSASSVFNRR